MNSHSQTQPIQPAQQQKFLRYRSVRKNAVKEPTPESPPPLPQPSQTSLTRLPSRYHRRLPPATEASLPPKIPETIHQRGQTTALRSTDLDEAQPSDQRLRNRNNDGRRINIEYGQRPRARETRGRDNSHKHTSSLESPQTDDLRKSSEAAREEARLILEGKADRLEALRRQEARRRREQQELRDQQREQKLVEEARLREAETKKGVTTRVAASHNEHGGVRKGTEAEATAQPLPPDYKKSKSRTLVIGGPPPSKTVNHHRRASSSVEQRQPPPTTHAKTTSLERMDTARKATPPSSVPNVPNIDAPISAVNAGERHVGVKCKEAFVTLPITPSTTTKDILHSASVSMSEPIDPRTAVLLESFSRLGLERPLRRYERIRDVMNSWDNDNQNHLFIMTATECAWPGLQEGDVPTQQPSGTTVQIYHSRKPRKWDKRLLKLRADGQITTSKNESGTDSTNICHLSDFDLYTPTQKQMKKLKPPQKLCFSLKSQEKSSMFLDGANFVHFFCTKDKAVADKWYQAVHSWRSWYLVNMLGEGQPKQNKTDLAFSMGLQSGGSNMPGTAQSKDPLPYACGSSKPLLDFGPSRPSLEGGGGTRRPGELDFLGLSRSSQSDGSRPPLLDLVSERQSSESGGAGVGKPQGSPRHVSNQPPSGPPPTAFPRGFMLESTVQANTATPDDPDASPFTGTGLLARSASRRSQGGSSTGRGVPGIEGKPLVDLQPASEFTDGSLLRKMEATSSRHGVLGPKIDRQKGREVNVSVGEGFG
ncbi:uncharacterized protein Z518_07687 [Rhinocladiella mackenziei CBS 650.93]|uniref:PH domain-containing protein n=1 Tax=Rhinocladiella mackenziei CBS 650.93 TaxID=1442369 RepID=A0A0D2IE85_9EURO|nr:uncharacterized protein Z518_07687 [Rhinocladiella mackenziei CBS 650.93]KIX04134.1 hypothetical protein Z518_07687 [Rhinocladiella mackenziei CBS 650.93]